MEQQIEKFLTSAAALIRVNGWVSRKDVINKHHTVTSTADLAWHYKRNVEAGTFKDIITEEDKNAALEALEWIRSLPENRCDNQYLKSLKAFCIKPMVHYQDSGYVASLLRTCYNYKQQKAKDALQQSQHVGQVGEEIEARVKILKVSPTKFGKMFKMTDAGGNIFVYFAKYDFANEGDIFKLKGKIKKHEDFQGVKSNILHYCVRE